MYVYIYIKELCLQICTFSLRFYIVYVSTVFMGSMYEYYWNGVSWMGLNVVEVFLIYNIYIVVYIKKRKIKKRDKIKTIWI